MKKIHLSPIFHFRKFFQHVNLILFPKDMDDDETFKVIYKKCKPYTMTNFERMLSLYKSIEYI
jgi:hypothetical protein